MSPTRAMVWIDRAMLRQGSEDFYPEERPVRDVGVDAFWIDRGPVTNAQFRRFVRDTGHLTVAERPPDPEDFPDACRADLVPGSLVFTPTRTPVPLDDWRRWWRWVPGATWRHPEGPGSTLHGRDLHPVVHVGHEDAVAYADWVGGRLPDEQEWELAARGGLVGATYPWGDDPSPRGRVMANTWLGDFPWRPEGHRTHGRTSAVGRFPPNGFGLLDVVGNVWEWTASTWAASHEEPSSCCGPRAQAAGESTRMVMKGGSHVCAPSYCHRYRPAARQGQAIRSTTGHLGFRCARSD